MMKRDVAVIILYDSKKKILLQHRSESAERLPGYWAFFGGGIEQCEEPEEAVRREALEELHYQLTNPDLVMVQEFKGRSHQGTKYVFMEEYNPAKKIVLGEGQDMGWFSLDGLVKLKIVNHDREVLRYIKGKY